jgi:hypothetical protein
MHISEVSIHRKLELARRGPMECLGVAKATPREELWRTDWVSPMATATTTQNKAPNLAWSFQ